MNQLNAEDIKLAEELDRRFRENIRKAVKEAYANNQPALADALDTANEYMTRSRDLIVARLKQLNIYTFTPEQYSAILDMTSQHLASEAISKIKEEELQRQQSFWARNSAKWGVIISAITLAISVLVIAVNAAISLWFKTR